MNKIIIGALGIVVTIGVGYIVITGGLTKHKVSDTSSNTLSGSNQTVIGSLKDLLATNTSLKCTFDTTVEVGKTSGTIYLNNGRIHGDYIVTQTGSTQIIEAHMTVEGTTMYYWMKDQPQGFKIPFDVNKIAEQKKSNGSINMDQFTKEFNYNCLPWIVDNSIFALPQGITFMTMGGGMTSPTTNGAVMPTGGVAPSGTQQCAACEQIPNASAKAQCKVALHCK